jgi:hypothetical protein
MHSLFASLTRKLARSLALSAQGARGDSGNINAHTPQPPRAPPSDQWSLLFRVARALAQKKKRAHAVVFFLSWFQLFTTYAPKFQ